MIIHNIRIENFKSIYGSQYFDFDKMKGLIKLSGPIGSGKTTIGSAILYGLYGKIAQENNRELIAWNTKACEVEMNITSKGKNIHIVRNIYQPLVVEIDGKLLNASNKRDTQNILEEELYDVPKLAVVKMCIISFNAFNGSLAAMNPYETKTFLDDIFGFKLFTDYNNEVVVERKNQMNENVKLKALSTDIEEQIKHLEEKKVSQQKELSMSIDVDEMKAKRNDLIETGKKTKNEMVSCEKEKKEKLTSINSELTEVNKKITETTVLGKQAKSHYNTFKSGVCPTCGSIIDEAHIKEWKDLVTKYASDYNELNITKNEIENKKSDCEKEFNARLEEYANKIAEIKKQIQSIDNEINSYNNSLKVINENYDDLIKEYNDRANDINEKLKESDIEIGQWNEMNDLFTKTLRYNLLESLIPHINKSIQFFINRLEQSYRIEYDQEFKAHIYVDNFDKEISYNNLSTGQRKSLDLAIIFGILQNIISNVDCNILFLDELMSNMDANARNTMISLIKEQMSSDKTIFVINHAEMMDDFFDHKIRVSLQNKKIISASINKGEDVIVQASQYKQEF